MRVVLDTSSLVSYILTGGTIMRQVIAAWRCGEFSALSSPQTHAELMAVLARPEIQARSQTELSALADGMAKFTLYIPGQVRVVDVCRDPKDDKFLACAIEGQAEYLVTSDGDLLEIGQYQEICILNPGQFLVALQLARLSVEVIRAQYSRQTLEKIQAEVHLDAATKEKVAQVLEE